MNLTASFGTPARATRLQSKKDMIAGMVGTSAKCTRSRPRHDLVGYGNLLSAMKFMRWAIEQDHFPTPDSVMTHFRVCRATAYRWTAALVEAYGIDPACRHGGRG